MLHVPDNEVILTLPFPAQHRCNIPRSPDALDNQILSQLQECGDIVRLERFCVPEVQPGAIDVHPDQTVPER